MRVVDGIRLFAVEGILLGAFLGWALVGRPDLALVLAGVPWSLGAILLLVSAPRLWRLLPASFLFFAVPNAVWILGLACWDWGWVSEVVLVLGVLFLPPGLLLAFLHRAYGRRNRAEAARAPS